ncbi:Ubiquitin specific peptidase 35 [Balamuthia mandrillaris]
MQTAAAAAAARGGSGGCGGRFLFRRGSLLLPVVGKKQSLALWRAYSRPSLAALITTDPEAALFPRSEAAERDVQFSPSATTATSFSSLLLLRRGSSAGRWPSFWQKITPTTEPPKGANNTQTPEEKAELPHGACPESNPLPPTPPSTTSTAAKEESHKAGSKEEEGEGGEANEKGHEEEKDKEEELFDVDALEEELFAEWEKEEPFTPEEERKMLMEGNLVDHSVPIPTSFFRTLRRNFLLKRLRDVDPAFDVADVVEGTKLAFEALTPVFPNRRQTNKCKERGLISPAIAHHTENVVHSYARGQPKDKLYTILKDIQHAEIVDVLADITRNPESNTPTFHNYYEVALTLVERLKYVPGPPRGPEYIKSTEIVRVHTSFQLSGDDASEDGERKKYVTEPNYTIVGRRRL